MNFSQHTLSLSKFVMREKSSFTGHNERPSTCKSRSTSCWGGTSPSALDARGSSIKKDETARAAVHGKIDPHRRRHDHSALLRNKGTVPRDSDHLPPTSTPRTTKRDLSPGPTNSGYLRSSLRRAAAKATPPVTAALWSVHHRSLKPLSSPATPDKRPSPPPLRRGLHTTTRETPNMHISGPRHFKHHQNSRKGPQKERRKKENCGGRGKKKARNFGPPHPRTAPTRTTPTRTTPTRTTPTRTTPTRTTPTRTTPPTRWPKAVLA